jgi:hypothetical protein
MLHDLSKASAPHECPFDLKNAGKNSSVSAILRFVDADDSTNVDTKNKLREDDNSAHHTAGAAALSSALKHTGRTAKRGLQADVAAVQRRPSGFCQLTGRLHRFYLLTGSKNPAGQQSCHRCDRWTYLFRSLHVRTTI